MEGHEIVRRSLAEQTAEAMLDDIVNGDLGEGKSLPASRRLAERYGVSVIVIREALARLEGRGALSRRQGRRTRLVRPGHEALSSILRLSAHQDDISVDELQTAREGLEVHAAALAAVNATAADRAELVSALEGMKAARTENEFNDSDIAFHIAVARASANRPIALILAALHDVVREAMTATYSRVRGRSGRRGIAIALQLHQQTYDAIVAADPDAAAQAMRRHFEFSAGHTARTTRGKRREVIGSATT